MELDISGLRKYFQSTGAKDHPYFWINGAENFIPNMRECISLTNYSPNVKCFDDFDNEHMDTLKDLFIKYGSDKFIHPYYKYYSNILSNINAVPELDRGELNILEIGLGTKDPTIPSTMFFYKQDRNFESTPGSSLRAFRDFAPGSNVYGADIDEKILFQEERIKTMKVDQLEKNELGKLFEGVNFDFIVIDGLHHITADVNSIVSLIDRLKPNSKLIVEDIVLFDNWRVVDFIISKIDGVSTEFVSDNDSNVFIYVISK